MRWLSSSDTRGGRSGVLVLGFILGLLAQNRVKVFTARQDTREGALDATFGTQTFIPSILYSEGNRSWLRLMLHKHKVPPYGAFIVLNSPTSTSSARTDLFHLDHRREQLYIVIYSLLSNGSKKQLSITVPDFLDFDFVLLKSSLVGTLGIVVRWR